MSNPYSTFGNTAAGYMSGVGGQSYKGALADAPSDSVLPPTKRRRMNLMAVFANAIAPWVAFIAVFAAKSFFLRYTNPMLVFWIMMLGFGLSGLSAFFALRSQQRERDPSWYMFFAAMLFLAVQLASVGGDMIYRIFMEPAYDFANLNSYSKIDPATQKGQQLMDAGRVTFTDTSGIDMRKSMGFKNIDTYCVAPIVSGEDQLASYDFWAVGVNCCSSASAEFQCGEFNNPNAHAGLRLMREDQRPFFRLAVQQAEAAYNIRSAHPIFLTWMQDPVAEVDGWRSQGFKYFALGVMGHFGLNLFFVACAIVGFSKLG